MNNLVHAPLGEVAKLNPALSSASALADESVDFLPMSAVDAGRSIAIPTEFRQFQDVRQGYTNFADGDVLLAKITPCFENGKIAQVQLKNRYGFGSTEFHVLRADSNRLDSRYLVHFLRRDQIRVDGARNMTGSGGQRRVPKHFIESLIVPLPPLSEQRRIAAILDQADALRAKRREALAQLNSLTQSIFIEMFGDPATNPMGWDTVELSELIAAGDSINYGVIQPGDDNGDGIPLIRVGDLIDGRVRHDSLKRIAPSIEGAYKRSRLRGNEILVSCVGTIGLVALVEPTEIGFNIARAVARIPLSDASNRRFVASHLQTASVQRYFTQELRTVSQPTLNIKQLAETKVMCPPKALQAEFDSRIAAFEKLKSAEKDAQVQLDALFASLQHRAFRGEL